ncbi:hypothetical protein WJX74_009916 [Apatococcus lobatus]|uniref:RING-type domain-containing protein n=1 Tax=Apatococcus lobatus TaxID=904363 RepID=A0AAW1S823_9CHLO
MVRHKARPQRDPQFSTPVNIYVEEPPLAGVSAEDAGPSTDLRTETSAEEDVPLGQRIFRPAKRRRLGTPQQHTNRQQKQRSMSAEQQWDCGSSSVCRCLALEPCKLSAFRTLPLEMLLEPVPVSLTGLQQLRVMAQCSDSQQTEIELLVVTPQGQYKGVITLHSMSQRKNVFAELRAKRLACCASGDPERLILSIGLQLDVMECRAGAEAHEEDRSQKSSSFKQARRWLVSRSFAVELSTPEEATSEPAHEGQPIGSMDGPKEANKESHDEYFDAATIYSLVKPRGTEAELQRQPHQLLPQLRPYQRRAARWMLDRELCQTSESSRSMHPLWQPIQALDGRQLFFCHASGHVSLKCPGQPFPVQGGILADEMGLGKTVELLACLAANPFPGDRLKMEEALDEAPAIDRRERIDCFCGMTGEPDDEDDYEGLWLGCSECLAWMHGSCVGFAHKAPPGDYVCRRCLVAKACAEVTVPCPATLIVCPPPILDQWASEIARHTRPGAFKVAIYEGQEARASAQQVSQPGVLRGIVSAQDLAAADIVLTTYDALRKDVHRQADPRLNERSLRRPKRWQVAPTPLTRLKWWRVVMDEAQMVERPSQAAALARQLEATHRWAISGTPVSNGLNDIGGLLLFLRAAPWDDGSIWGSCVVRPCNKGLAIGKERLLQILSPVCGGLMWRNSMADVADDLGLPPQHQRKTDLQLSAIERHFYTRQHQACAAKARQVLGQVLASAPSRRLTPHEEKRLLLPLLRLRQACCHPQVGVGGIKTLGQARTPMTMDEILQVLTGKAKQEAEEAQRILCGALNGLAALHLIDQDHGLAIKTYRQVLSVAEANKELIRADPLQRLHTMHNLGEQMSRGRLPAGIARTLRDSTLARDGAEIRDHYLTESAAKSAAATQDYKTSLKAMVDVQKQAVEGEYRLKGSRSGSREAQDQDAGWWHAGVRLIMEHGADSGYACLQHIQEQLRERDTYRQLTTQNATSLARRFQNLPGLQLVVQQELEALDLARKAALADLDRLAVASTDPAPEMVEQAGHCGRCRAELGVQGSVCQHCHLDDLFLAWEVRLYSLQTRAAAAGGFVTAEDAIRQEQAKTLRRVGRGGLNEATGPTVEAEAALAAEAGTSLEGTGHRSGVVAGTEIIRQPCEAEQVLRLLTTQLRTLRNLPASLGSQREEILQLGKAHLESLELQRKAYVKARAHAMAQRSSLYARDELEMSVMRLRVRHPHEHVALHEEAFKLHPAEVPVRNKELTMEKLVAEADLARTLGTLRYLEGLKAARHKSLAGVESEAAGAAGPSDTTKEGGEVCPVCQESLRQDLVMLPCAHSLCYKCSMQLVERSSSISSPKGKRQINCPTCRARTGIDDLAYIDGKAGNVKDEGQENAAGEARLLVKGSYGSKVCLLKSMFQ